MKSSAIPSDLEILFILFLFRDESKKNKKESNFYAVFNLAKMIIFFKNQRKNSIKNSIFPFHYKIDVINNQKVAL